MLPEVRIKREDFARRHDDIKCSLAAGGLTWRGRSQRPALATVQLYVKRAGSMTHGIHVGRSTWERLR